MITAQSVRAQFRTRAVIDWIEITVTLQSGTQFRYLQSQLQSMLELGAKPFVELIDAGAGKVAKRLAFRLHAAHANTLDELQHIMTALADKYPFAEEPEVTGIEVAVDFYPKYDEGDLPPLVYRLQSSLEAFGNPRQFVPNKAPKPKHCNRFLNPDRPEPVTGLKIDPNFNLRIKNTGDPIQWQVYDKRTDKGQPVEPGERRARAEFTLSASELARRVLGSDAGSRPVTLDTLRTFKFEKLAGLLHFRHHKPIEAIAASHVIALVLPKLVGMRERGITNYDFGRTAYYRDKRRSANARRKSTRKHSVYTAADAELNHIVRRTLKALTGKFA